MSLFFFVAVVVVLVFFVVGLGVVLVVIMVSRLAKYEVKKAIAVTTATKQGNNCFIGCTKMPNRF